MSTLLAALSVLAFPASHEGVPLLCAPAVSSTATIELESELSVSGGELAVFMGGSEVPAQYLPELHLEEQERFHVVLTQTLHERDGERCVWLRRYDELRWSDSGSMSMSGPDGSGDRWPWEVSCESPLEGRTLRLVVDGDELVSVGLADERLPVVDLPPGLGFELGWQALLPGRPVGSGDAWEVDGAVLGALWRAGGELGWIVPEEAAEHLDPPFDEREHGGALRLSCASLEDGQARIEVRGELERTTVRPGDLSRVPVADGSATDTVEERWEVEGRLVWDTVAGGLAELTLEGSWRSETATVRDPGQEGPDYESTFSVGGTRAFRARSAPAAEGVVEAAAGRR